MSVQLPPHQMTTSSIWVKTLRGRQRRDLAYLLEVWQAWKYTNEKKVPKRYRRKSNRTTSPSTLWRTLIWNFTTNADQETSQKKSKGHSDSNSSLHMTESSRKWKYEALCQAMWPMKTGMLFLLFVKLGIIWIDNRQEMLTQWERYLRIVLRLCLTQWCRKKELVWTRIAVRQRCSMYLRGQNSNLLIFQLHTQKKKTRESLSKSGPTGLRKPIHHKL